MQNSRMMKNFLRHAVARGSNNVGENVFSGLVIRNVLKLTLMSSCLLANAAQAQFRAYVSNVSSNDVSLIDTATNTVVATIPVGGFPIRVAITSNGTRAYVTNYISNT